MYIKKSQTVPINWMYRILSGNPTLGALAVSGDFSGYHDWQEGTSGWRPGMLPNIPRGTGQPSPQRRIQPKVSIVPRLRTPVIK